MVASSSARVAKLAQLLDREDWDVLFTWAPVTMGYIHGFFEYGHERFVSLAIHRSGAVALICPALSANQATRVGIQDIRTWSDGEDPYRLVRALAEEWGFVSGTIGLDNDMPAHMVLGIQHALPHATVTLGAEAISALRRVKEDAEIELLKHSGSIADATFKVVIDAIRPGMTEIQIQDVIQAELKRRGGTPTFCIVAIGAGAAEPHHLNDDTVVRDGDLVLLDFGCEYQGYQSDITRTVNCGKANEETKRVYEIVYQAFTAGRNAIKPGVEAQAVDAAARKVIEDAGYGAAFYHRLGHGIGMQGHEEPNLVAGNRHQLEVGNCFSVEPGIYLEGRFGVRIENIVAVSLSGHVSMNEEPSPTLIEIPV